MHDLTFKLDESSGIALYLQIYSYIRSEIAEGRIRPETKLPSVRILSSSLGVSRTPVALAYDQLLAEGYVRSKPRSGLYAVRVDALTPPPAADGPAAGEKSPPRAYHASPDEPVRYDFGYGGIDLASFPFQKWRKLMNRCFWPENRSLFLYGDLQGEPELRGEIASYLRQIRGVRCTPEQIVVGAGTYHSLDLLFQLLKEEVTVVGAERAVNVGIKALFSQYGFQCRPLPLEPDGIRLEDVYESGAQAVYVTPSHQFPFGMTLSAGKRSRLLNWAEERQAYIIENDYDGEFRYGGRPIPSLQGLDNSGRVIYAGTFSKALTPSFRISYLVLPPALLARFRLMRHSYDQLASPILQKTLQMFMQTGDFERHMRKMRSLYQRKRDTLLQAIRQKLPDEIEIIGAGSGLHVLLRTYNGLNEEQLIARAKLNGVAVYPTSTYALEPDSAPPATVLLGFGGLSEELIREGIDKLAEAWRL
ncbi:PLP-dependent aminotransferase family protein [Paenibacillus sp. MBLB4367]|uniref:MocR-like pyridoxine biosynthesis transcription factor PdxR n=1 Tax=Paenibacillus sp. MBLB4367 TaxID=3384767 RepID=UPI003908418D